MAMAFHLSMDRDDQGAGLLLRNIAALHEELERLRRLDPLFNSDEFLPALLGSIHEGGICIYNLAGDILSFWLPLDLQVRMGMPAETMVGRNLRDFHPPQSDVFDERMALMHKVVQTGQTVRQEYFAGFPGGGFWMETTLSPLCDHSGIVRYIISFFRDITPRKTAELARDESEARYRGIVENSIDAIMLTRPDGIIDYISPSSAEVLGWPPEALVGIRPNIIHPDDFERVHVKFQRSQHGENGSSFEYRILTQDGRVRWVSHSWSPVFGEGRLKIIVSILRDVTERKRLEHDLRQAERLATIGQTVADIAHQLKTVCLNIRGSATLIDRALDEGRIESLRTLWSVFQRSSDRLGHLAIEMLAYAGLDTVQLEPLDPNRVVREVFAECQGKAARRNVLLRLKLGEAMPSIQGDEARLGEALLNLIDNAIDACDNQTVGLVDVLTTVDKDRRQLRFEVYDNGPGIPDEIARRIFDPFFTTKGAKGTGLGLAIAQKAVKLHGGHIEIDSQPGQTSVAVILPLDGAL